MIGIVKSDNRFKELSKCVNSIYSDELVDFFNIDILVLPIKGIDSNGFINNHLNIIDILKNNKIKRIITGLANDYLKELSREYSIELTILMNERSFVDGNSRLTALGIYSYLLNNKKLNKDIIIIGFGNISFYLASLFKLFNIKFSIYTPNIIEQKFVKLLNYNNIDNVYDGSLLINTIPKNLDWDYKKLIGMDILDVASCPYGFDMLKLSDGTRYEILSNIPALFYPFEAMKLILDEL